MIRRRKIVNYLSNKELLKEIHKSKISYSEFDKPEYADYDLIVQSLKELNAKKLEQAKKNRARRLNDLVGDKLFEEQNYTNKQIEAHIKKHGIKPSNIKKEELVIRVMTTDHIPDVKDKKGKTVKAPVNFPPFIHYAWRNKKWTNVGQSHTQNKKFSTKHGEATRKLALSYLKIVDRYGNRGNWRNYTWIEEMKGQALVRLSQAGLQFNEAKTDNPFAYFTTIINHSFTQILNKEKENISTRNKMIQESGYNPSFNEMADFDMDNYARDNAPKLVKGDDE